MQIEDNQTVSFSVVGRRIRGVVYCPAVELVEVLYGSGRIRRFFSVTPVRLLSLLSALRLHIPICIGQSLLLITPV